MIENNRILIVDDDPGIRDSYKGILSPSHTNNLLSKGASLFDGPKESAESASQNQYSLILTDRGAEGIQVVEKAIEGKQPFAVAFIDMKMPGIDGAETAKGIWLIDPDIKIVIVTAFSEYTPDDIIRITGRDDIFYYILKNLVLWARSEIDGSALDFLCLKKERPTSNIELPTSNYGTPSAFQFY